MCECILYISACVYHDAALLREMMSGTVSSLYPSVFDYVARVQETKSKCHVSHSTCMLAHACPVLYCTPPYHRCPDRFDRFLSKENSVAQPIVLFHTVLTMEGRQLDFFSSDTLVRKTRQKSNNAPNSIKPNFSYKNILALSRKSNRFVNKRVLFFFDDVKVKIGVFSDKRV